MKNYILLLSLFALVSCDAPQRTRAPETYVNGNTFNTGTTPPGSLTPSIGLIPGTTTPGVPVTSSPGFENCNLSDRYHTIDIGLFGLCQSTMDETAFKFKTSLSSSTVRTCLIPTYKDANGASTYIGNPQCTLTVSQQIINGKLYKDRPGFASYPLNGVIVMKEPLLPEYIGCMQGYVNWPGNACPAGLNTQYCVNMRTYCPYGGRTSAQCDVEARNFMANLCNTFKSKYANSYIDIRTRQ